MARRNDIDWEAVEIEYRAGVRSLKDIGAEFGVSDAGIIKRAKRDEWVRDLGAKIKAKAESLVSERDVSAEVSAQTVISERQVVNASAQMLADKVLGQRSDVQRARSIVQRLWDLVDVELDHPKELEQLGAMMAAPDEFGNDKLNDMYHVAIGLPQQIKNVKLLADSLKVLIELERKVLRLDEQKPVEASPLADLVKAVSGTALPVVANPSLDDDDE